MLHKNGYGKAFKAAFPFTIPVLTGYLFIGMAFGVMIEEKGYHFLWAMFMSLLCYAGSGQYLAVNFFAPGVSLINVIVMEFMVNIRHIFYGLSLLERFQKMGRKRIYMMFSLTDETYSLFFITKVPKDVDEHKFMFAIAVLDQSYWIIGSGLGALLGSIIPFNAKGIDFAMTALFLVIMVEQWMEEKNRKSVLIGVGSAVVCLLLFGPDNFILPSMISIMTIQLSCKKYLLPEETKEELPEKNTSLQVQQLEKGVDDNAS